MDTFNIIVGIFSAASALVSIFSYFQAKKAKMKAVEVQNQLVKIESHIQSIQASGGRIQAGGNITAGKGIHVQGGAAANNKNL